MVKKRERNFTTEARRHGEKIIFLIALEPRFFDPPLVPRSGLDER
jgi:hypothetical protein